MGWRSGTGAVCIGLALAATAAVPLRAEVQPARNPVLATLGARPATPAPAPAPAMTPIQGHAHPVACVFSADQCHHAAEAAGFHHFQIVRDHHACPLAPHLLCRGIR